MSCFFFISSDLADRLFSILRSNRGKLVYNKEADFMRINNSNVKFWSIQVARDI